MPIDRISWSFFRVPCSYYVYIVASSSRVLYVGVTNDLVRRVFEHRQHFVEGFTKKYRCTRLVYFEEGGDVIAAIGREKQIKGWRREKKIALIAVFNPKWHDLYLEFTA
ncbi:MAG: GIY-YIG nuclease family protein [Burkholderiaceae bacterium]